MNDLQNRLFIMLCWFHDYCEENEIRYYAIGGTMLGAARHKGFIPWDDDIDLGVPRKDYNKLIGMFQKPIDGYYLESPYSGNRDFLYSFSKLYDINSTLIEHTRYDCKRGIYIDIFPLDGVGNSKEEAVSNVRQFDRKNMLLMMRTCAIRKERRWYKNLSIHLARLIPSFVINEKNLAIQLDQLANKMNDEEAVYWANMNGAYRYKEIVKGELFGEPTLYEFEGKMINGPQKYNEYLTEIYGDWSQLPPEDRRKTEHDFVNLDLNNSYMK